MKRQQLGAILLIAALITGATVPRTPAKAQAENPPQTAAVCTSSEASSLPPECGGTGRKLFLPLVTNGGSANPAPVTPCGVGEIKNVWHEVSATCKYTLIQGKSEQVGNFSLNWVLNPDYLEDGRYQISKFYVPEAFAAKAQEAVQKGGIEALQKAAITYLIEHKKAGELDLSPTDVGALFLIGTVALGPGFIAAAIIIAVAVAAIWLVSYNIQTTGDWLGRRDINQKLLESDGQSIDGEVAVEGYEADIGLGVIEQTEYPAVYAGNGRIHAGRDGDVERIRERARDLQKLADAGFPRPPLCQWYPRQGSSDKWRGAVALWYRASGISRKNIVVVVNLDKVSQSSIIPKDGWGNLERHSSERPQAADKDQCNYALDVLRWMHEVVNNGSDKFPPITPASIEMQPAGSGRQEFSF